MDASTFQPLLTSMFRLLDQALFRPESLWHLGISLGLGLTLLTISLLKIHKLAKAPSASSLTSIFVACIGATLLLASAAAAQHFWTLEGTWTFLPAAIGALVALMILVAPLTRYAFGSRYVISTGAWVISLALAAGLAWGSGWIYRNTSVPERTTTVNSPEQAPAPASQEERPADKGKTPEKAPSPSPSGTPEQRSSPPTPTTSTEKRKVTPDDPLKLPKARLDEDKAFGREKLDQ